ncbi:ABC transporter ATP-binding protein [Alterinioella nitratireducens]|uniref:ABC transporter ATP-binding protein n=1 Tax=Alterinioella nitratireducens TaxID=2735915 RepID=UPI001554CB13|nr:ABC transporter ATP-binding protein [Alterinioella nitratireducens]NPD21477.1 ABC transporter ATP-binding protein [Alterinioella nitratireducens]
MVNGYDITLSDLRKHYRRRDGSSVRAIDHISLDIRQGEFVVLLGSSGCGKTTLLRCIAGLEAPDAGAIRIDGKPVFDSASNLFTPPEHRRIGMMFQSYALWPHMTIRENIQFPLKMQKVDKASAEKKIAHVLEMMHIGELAQQYPNQLSGGQQQRVALARAMVCSENLLLFDEPLSNVDAMVREHLRTELSFMQKELGFTAIYVTHDQEEAMAMADRIVVLGGGRIWQHGSPEEIYHEPVDGRVAAFVGSANLIPGQLAGTEISTALGSMTVPAGQIRSRGTEVAIMSRPEHWRLSAAGEAGGVASPEGALKLRGTVRLITHLGPHTDYIVAVGGQEIRVRAYGSRRLRVGDAVDILIATADLLVLDPDCSTGDLV